MDILAIIGAVVSIVTLLALVGGGFYWWGRLSSRVDGLSSRVDGLSEEIKAVRDEVQSVRSEVQSVRSEVQSVRTELLTEMRRSEDRILTALTRHSHVSPEAGPPVFWQPVGMASPVGSSVPEAPAAGHNPGADAPDA